jgi:hypothetical protein
MASVANAMKAKSDQLNFVDIGTGELVLFVTGVNVTNSDQPIAIFFKGCNDRPYKPSKGMIRLLSEAWGDESDNWIGKVIKLYGDPSVTWAGEAIGGLRIRSLSDIDKKGFSAFVTITRGKRRKTFVEFFEIPISEDDQSWIDAIKKDPSVIDQIADIAYKNMITNLINSGGK